MGGRRTDGGEDGAAEEHGAGVVPSFRTLEPNSLKILLHLQLDLLHDQLRRH